MDDSLRFKSAAPATSTQEEEPTLEKIEKDFRGVQCPMNFVKTKLVLETMSSGQELLISLDDGAAINNVPNSVKLEGHQVLSQEKQADGHWNVLIKKA